MDMKRTVSLLLYLKTKIQEIALPHFVVSEQSIEVHLKNSPYIFIMKHFSSLGWHVILKPITDVLEIDDDTKKILDILESVTDEWNLTYHEYREPEYDFVYGSLVVLQSAIKHSLQKNPRSYRKEPGVFRLYVSESESIDVGYSKIFEQWYITANSTYNDQMKSVYNLIDEWNDPIMKIHQETIQF